MNREQRNNAEIERGRFVAARAQRRQDLERLTLSTHVRVTVALQGHPLYEDRGQVNIFYVGVSNEAWNKGVSGIPPCAHENTNNDDYPSEATMARILLGIAALEGQSALDNVPTLPPTHEVSAGAREYRKNHVLNWSDK